MDGFTGFKTATAEELPDAVAVMTPSTSSAWPATPWTAADAGSSRSCPATAPRRRPALPGEEDPAHRRRPAHKKQTARLTALFAADEHVQVQATWGIYERMIAAYRQPDRNVGKQLVQQLINATSRSVPAVLTEIIILSRTLTRRAADVLAYFDRPQTSNGPTEAINGRLEHLRGTALGFRNLTNYIAKSLLKTAGSDPTAPRIVKSHFPAHAEVALKP